MNLSHWMQCWLMESVLPTSGSRHCEPIIRGQNARWESSKSHITRWTGSTLDLNVRFSPHGTELEEMTVCMTESDEEGWRVGKDRENWDRMEPWLSQGLLRHGRGGEGGGNEPVSIGGRRWQRRSCESHSHACFKGKHTVTKNNKKAKLASTSQLCDIYCEHYFTWRVQHESIFRGSIRKKKQLSCIQL